MQTTHPVLARGVSSAARLRSIKLILKSARGSFVYTQDDEELVDYMLGLGPVLLGHCRPEVMDSVRSQLDRGELYGTVAAEEELAQKVVGFMPWAQHVAFLSTGSEATHLAIRMARAATGRRLIVKFEGHYHGWVDPLFVNTQNNHASTNLGAPVPLEHSVPGMDPEKDVVVIRWNRPDELLALFDEWGPQIAGVILEPIPLNFATLTPHHDYTPLLRDLTEQNGSLLIFDEVLSGFRLASGGAAELLGVTPDIGVYAKAVANGFPLAVVAGREQAMEPITSGPILPAGTYSGNAVSVQAGLATLGVLKAHGATIYPHLEKIGARISAGITTIAEDLGAPLAANRVGSVLQLLWGAPKEMHNYTDASKSDRKKIAEICEALLPLGILVSPRGLILLSTEHTEEQADQFVEALKSVVTTILQKGP